MDTGTCRHCGKRIWRDTSGWNDRFDDAAILGSGLVCPVAYRHEPTDAD